VIPEWPAGPVRRVELHGDWSLREAVVLPQCRCQHAYNSHDRCHQETDSPDSWLCRSCAEEHRPGAPDSPFVVVPL